MLLAFLLLFDISLGFNIYWLKNCYIMSKNKKNRFNGAQSRPTGNDNIHMEENPSENEVLSEDAQASPENSPAEIVDNFDAVEDGDESTDSSDTSSDENEIENLKAQLEKEKKEYLFLMAEFDNFRKRTLKEKSDIIKNAGEKVFKGLLPIVDDMERGIKASENATDVATVREGLILIYNKLVKFMEANGVKAYEDGDGTFDAERHEAITAVPVQDDSQKGKILDTIEKGYTINDKVLRHARVVVGQ